MNQKTTGDENSRLFLCDRDNYQYCKVEFFESGIVGTIVIPDKTDIIHKENYIGYFFVDNEIVFIDDSGIVSQYVENMKEDFYESPEVILCLFFEYLLSEEVTFFKDYEEKMTVMEEYLMHYDGEDISRWILICRKELQILQSYYHQLLDISEILEIKFPIYRKFTRKMERILSEVKNLRDDSLQIRELYQTQISVRQNKVMQLLTVVTTIFMPLNLLTGWYGMNFIGMRELDWEYGYLVISILSIVFVCLEIWYLKRKKWFL